jgi:hypothetical protein
VEETGGSASAQFFSAASPRLFDGDQKGAAAGRVYCVKNSSVAGLQQIRCMAKFSAAL